ncbi:MAG: mechanosensitive ion channel family protein [Gemmatimonadetes bacterium]|nr:mechanosensitive ion channel family protein [Gemmatimonadota bacterium]
MPTVFLRLLQDGDIALGRFLPGVSLTRAEIVALRESGLKILGILILAWIAYRVLAAILRRIEQAVSDGDPTSVSGREQRVWTLLGLVRSVGIAFIAVIALFMVLQVAGLDIGPLLAGAGVVGLAISFGAQSLVRDVISGLFILVENQFGVGDVIKVNNLSGRVERLTLRIVVMRDDKGIHIVPNGEIKQVTNLTRAFAREVVDVFVAYTEDVDRVISIMREVADEIWSEDEWHPLLTEEIAVPGVEGFDGSGIRIRMVVTSIPMKQFDVARELRRRLKNRFDAEKIEFPGSMRYPDQTREQGTGNREQPA